MLIGISFTFNSCINFKSEYPEVEYYRLTQENSQFKRNLKIASSMQIRNFSINEEFDTEHLIAQNPDKSIQRYFYHRWSGDISSMVTDYFVTKLNEYDYFAEGVFKSNSIRLPDYILEGQVMELIANNNPEKEGKNDVSISIRFSLLKRDYVSPDYKILFSKQYQIDVPRKDNGAKSIVPAFSVGFAQISDKLMKDIIEPIGHMEGE